MFSNQKTEFIQPVYRCTMYRISDDIDSEENGIEKRKQPNEMMEFVYEA